MTYSTGYCDNERIRNGEKYDGGTYNLNTGISSTITKLRSHSDDRHILLQLRSDYIRNSYRVPADLNQQIPSLRRVSNYEDRHVDETLEYARNKNREIDYVQEYTKTFDHTMKQSKSLCEKKPKLDRNMGRLNKIKSDETTLKKSSEGVETIEVIKKDKVSKKKDKIDKNLGRLSVAQKKAAELLASDDITLQELLEQSKDAKNYKDEGTADRGIIEHLRDNYKKFFSDTDSTEAYAWDCIMIHKHGLIAVLEKYCNISDINDMFFYVPEHRTCYLKDDTIEKLQEYNVMFDQALIYNPDVNPRDKTRKKK